MKARFAEWTQVHAVPHNRSLHSDAMTTIHGPFAIQGKLFRFFLSLLFVLAYPLESEHSVATDLREFI